jgi:hypothetical protein
MHRFQSPEPYTPPPDVLDIFRRELGGNFQLPTHPHVIGYRSRMWILEELIRHAKAKGKVWCGTHRQGRAGPGRTCDFALAPFGGAAFLRAARSNQGAAGQEAAIHYDAFAIDEIRRARGEEGDCSGYVARVAGSSTWDHRQK